MKRIIRQFLPVPKLPRGDTIIEVLLAISIFALVLVVTLVSTNRSLHSGTDATNRQQALTLADQQVEFIKNALGTDLSTLQNYTTAPATFCIDPSTGGVQDASAATKPCNNVGGSQYDLVITHASSSSNSTVFKVTTSWPSTTSTTTDSLFVYYKVPGAGPTPPAISSCSVSVTNPTAPGAATLSGIVDPNGKTTTWHFSYGTSLSFGTNVPVPDGSIPGGAGPTPVSQSLSGLGGGTYYFTLVATNTDGAASCSSIGQFTINSPPPPPPTVTLTPSPTTVSAGGSSTLTWTVSGIATSCKATSSPNDPAWNPGTKPSPSGGNQSVSPSATTTYTIDCTGPGGTSSPANATVTVSSGSGATPYAIIKTVNWQPNPPYPGCLYNAVCLTGVVNPESTQPWYPYFLITDTHGLYGAMARSGINAGTGGSFVISPGTMAVNSVEDPVSETPAFGGCYFGCGDTNQFGFLMCASNSPSSFPNKPGSDATHFCSNNVIYIALSGGSGGSGGGGGGSGLPVCFINVANDGNYTAYVVGADCAPHDAAGDSFTYSASGFYCAVSSCGWLFPSGSGASYTFSTAAGTTWVNLSVTFTVRACNANGCNSLSATTNWR